MENEILETIAERMLSEGVDEDTVITVLESLDNEEFAIEYSTSSNLNQKIPIWMKGALKNHIKPPKEISKKSRDAIKSHIESLKDRIALNKSQKRHLNKTISRKANLN